MFELKMDIFSTIPYSNENPNYSQKDTVTSRHNNGGWGFANSA